MERVVYLFSGLSVTQGWLIAMCPLVRHPCKASKLFRCLIYLPFALPELKNLISFSLPHLKSFPPILWGFRCFQSLPSNIFDQQVRIWGVLQAIGLGESRKIARAWFALPRWMSWKWLSRWAGAAWALLLPSAVPLFLARTFLRISVFSSAGAHFSMFFTPVMNKCWVGAFLVLVGQGGAPSPGTSSHGCSDREDPLLLSKDFCDPAMVGHRIPCPQTSQLALFL